MNPVAQHEVQVLVQVHDNGLRHFIKNVDQNCVPFFDRSTLSCCVENEGTLRLEDLQLLVVADHVRGASVAGEMVLKLSHRQEVNAAPVECNASFAQPPHDEVDLALAG